MRKLDTQRPYGRITPPHQGAHFEQDGLLFDQHGDCLTSEAPQPAADTASNGFVIDRPDGSETPLPHAAEDDAGAAETPPTARADDTVNRQGRGAHAELRAALRQINGHAPRARKELFDSVERLTGVRPETQQDGLDLLQAEGLWTA